MIAILLSEAGRAAAALAALVVPSAHAAEPEPVAVVEPVKPFKWEPLPEERRCLRTWRTAWYAAQALDIGTTVAGIESGRGKEANPVYKLLFGKHVKSWEVLALKGVTIAASEWSLKRSMDRDGDFDGACRSYKIGAGFIGGVAMLNLRVLF